VLPIPALAGSPGSGPKAVITPSLWYIAVLAGLHCAKKTSRLGWTLSSSGREIGSALQGRHIHSEIKKAQAFNRKKKLEKGGRLTTTKRGIPAQEAAVLSHRRGINKVLPQIKNWSRGPVDTVYQTSYTRGESADRRGEPGNHL